MATKAVSKPADALASQFFTDNFQRGLAHWNHERMAPGFPCDDWQAKLDRDLKMLRLEGGLIEALRAEIADEAAEAPADADGFIAWFEQLKERGPGQGDPLFPWIAEEASLEEVRWFLQQEAAGERIRRSRRLHASEAAGWSETRACAQLLGRDGPRQSRRACTGRCSRC
jgi:hypothetical protein